MNHIDTITAVNNTSHTFSYTMTGTPAANAAGADLIATTPGTTQNGSISRVSALMDHAGTSAGKHLEEYTYLGLQTIVAMNRPEADEELTYIQVSGDTHYLNDGDDRYTGLDRFGRVDDQFWYLTSSGTNAYSVDRVQYGYDRDGNVLFENNLGPSGTSGAPSATAAAFSQLYHANSTTSGDDNTAYDGLERLTAMRRGTLSASGNNGTVFDTVTTLNSTTGVSGNSKAWTLNAVGGWSSVTTDGTATSHTTNAQNETTAVGSAGLTYDNNGNLTKNAQGNTLKYDAWNRIVSTTYSSGYTFGYDALGEMVLYKITGSSANTFYYDNQKQLIEEYVSGVYSQFVYGMAYINEVILRDNDAGTGSNAYGIAGSGLKTRIYDQQDANWNTTSLYQTGGGSTGIVERLIYDAYGTPKTLTSSWASYTDTGIYWRFLFQGEYWLAETNTYIMGARNFDYTIGAWDQKDTIGYGDGMNDYQGFDSDPPGVADPSGHSGIAIVFGLGAFGVGPGAGGSASGSLIIGIDFKNGLFAAVTGTALAGPGGGAVVGAGPGISVRFGDCPKTGIDLSTGGRVVAPGVGSLAVTTNSSGSAVTVGGNLSANPGVGGAFVGVGPTATASVTATQVKDAVVSESHALAQDVADQVNQTEVQHFTDVSGGGNPVPSYEVPDPDSYPGQ